ncbi:MAG: hypothetical protein ACYS8W_11530 [Planctomycetota bacterium]
MDEDYGMEQRPRKPYKPPMGCMTKAFIWLIVIVVVLAGATFGVFKFVQKDKPDMTLKEFLTFAWKGTQKTVNEYKKDAGELKKDFSKWVDDRIMKSKKTQAWLDKMFPAGKAAKEGSGVPASAQGTGTGEGTGVPGIEPRRDIGTSYVPGTTERVSSGVEDPAIRKLREKYAKKTAEVPKPPEKKTVTLALNNKRLKDVLEAVSRRSGTYLIPEPAIEDMRVSLDVRDAEWREAIEQICGFNDLDYMKVDENLYYVTKKAKPPVVAKADPRPKPQPQPGMSSEIHPTFQKAADEFRRGLVFLQQRENKKAFDAFDRAQDYIEEYKRINPNDPRIEKFEEELALYKHGAMKDAGWNE